MSAHQQTHSATSVRISGSLLGHDLTRYREIRLPVKKLLVQFKENADVSLIRHFDILYIQQGISRLPLSERLELLPILVNGISSDYAKSPQHASQLFHLMLRLLAHFKLPLRGTKEDSELRSTLQISDEDGAFLSQWFEKLILLTPVRKASASDGSSPRCSGLSAEEYKFLTVFDNPDAWNPSASSGLNLTETKALAVRILASGMFKDEDKFLPALFASADSNSRVSEVGEDILKRVTQATDLENPSLIDTLLELYFGSTSSDGAFPVSKPLRIKILGILAKSVTTTRHPRQIARLVEDGLLSVEQDPSNAKASGREASKFRSAIFALVNFVARRGADADLALVAEGLVGNLRGFIEDQGWPSPDRDQDMEIRGYGYETIGLLAKAAPEKILMEPRLDLLEWLFRSLREDTSGKDVAVSIEESLSSVLSAFSKPFDDTLKPKFRQVLWKYSRPERTHHTSGSSTILRSTRYVATRFANRCLPFDDVLARWIDIVAVSGGGAERHEVVEEGRKGLDPYWFTMQTSVPGSKQADIAFPDLNELVNFIFAQLMQEDDYMDIDGVEGDVVALVRHFQQQYSEMIPAVINFCTQVGFHAALVEKEIPNELSEEWARKLETLVSSDPHARQAFRSFARDPQNSRSLALLLRASFNLLTQDDVRDIGSVGETLVRLCSLSAETSWKNARLMQDFRDLEPSVLANNPGRRMTASHCYGLIASHASCEESVVQKSQQRLLTRLDGWKAAVGGELNQISGAVSALGFYFSRLFWRNSSNLGADQTAQTFLETIIDILQTSKDTTLKAAVYSSIDQLSMYQVITPSSLDRYAKFRAIAQHVYDAAKAGSTGAINCFGHLSMVIPEEEAGSETESDYRFVSEKFHELHEIRQPEAQFTVGEALSCFAIGWNSKALTTQLDIEHPQQNHDPWDAPASTPEGPKREKTLALVLERTIKGCHQTKPALKKASVIWLISLLQYCGHMPEIQGYLTQCQTAFKVCLSDRDEVVQEAASRGLGLVYEKGDRSLKDDLVRDLVGSFSDNRPKVSGTVSEDTQLFEPGALPTGDGKSITTYKDILNLASEVGDSSLVYRFMSLASNNAIWSSRAAFGRFGLSNIFSDSSVDGYLSENPRLYPKLFRYRFDPNPNVQRSMNDIWNALVKDPTATIDKQFDAIMEDLLNSILTKEWRVRQASCAAIADLVQGRKMEKYEKYLDQIWDKCFKVLDDIKDSVRVAAASLARVLTSILTRSLEAGDSSLKNASGMLSRVLPFLLSPAGLESSAESVRLFAVTTLLEIVKKSNAKILNPHSPELVERLLGLLSTLEPEAVNYIHLNAKKYNLTEQKIDDMRLQSVRSSPLTESIERCLDLADGDTMKEMASHIEAAMKSAVGLPSKVGCSRVLVTLSTRHNFLFKPYADRYLQLIHKYIHDRNDTVSSSYAAAAGYVARLAGDKQLLSTISFCQKLYFDSEDDKSRLSSGDIILSISKNASDRFTSLAADLLPFVFLAKHDAHEQVRQLFKQTWEDNVAGGRAVLLYLKEITALATQHLESQKWNLKHTSAKTIADAVMSITTGIEGLDKQNAETLFPALDKAMSGKTWEGKEIVLDAFVRFVERGSSLWKSDAKVAKQIEKVAVREAKRTNKAYRPYALNAMGKICRARTDLRLEGEVWHLVEGIIDEIIGAEEEEGEKMDVDGGDVMKDVALREKTLAACVSVLCDSLNLLQVSTMESSTNLEDVLPMIVKANSTHAKDVHLATFTAVGELFERVYRHGVVIWEKAKAALEKIFFDPSFEGLPEAMRMKRGEALVKVSKCVGCEWVVERVKPEVEGGERSPVVRGVLGKIEKQH
ncbi:ARM repeat-containing protein [Sporormia fimetaria CBS 119925]|uniref:ARM repeat-containing protein n=1 Tax=Sporormia fimetaria CBS 119925 TaxID=1340428 RepID=A0A6A6VFY2_9PLEO|nr:ARM repeat-containing protein [Sporormia fimetaria CBS 119925]